MNRSIDELEQDIRYSARSLRRDLRFTLFAVLIVGLGIAASTTVFSVANALLVRSLPFREADNLVWIPNVPSDPSTEYSTQVGHFVDVVAQNRSFAGLAAYNAFFRSGDITLAGTDAGNAMRVSRVQLTRDFLPLLGVHPELGRQFNDDESSGSGASAVLISHSLWQRRFEGDSNIVGKSIVMNERSATIVGVLPASFDFGSVFAPGAHIDLFTPYPLTAKTNGNGNTLAVIGRLKPGVTVDAADAELRVLGAAIHVAHPERNTFAPRVRTLRAHVSGSFRPALVMLVIAVGVVMLIVCANLSNLLLVRATTRQREMAVRAALGAARRRLIRQLLTESVVLSALGAVVGVLLAVPAIRAIAHADAISLPLLAGVRLDGSALGVAVLLALAAGFAFGIAPALQLPEGRVHDALRASGRSATDSRRTGWVRRSLVMAEIALACVLLMASGLLVRSFLKLLDVDVGFTPERLVAIRIDPERQHLTSQARFIAYVDDVLRLSREMPGVEGAAIADELPLGGDRSWGVSAVGKVYERGHLPEAFVRMASDGLVSAMRIRLISGRDFSQQDGPSSERVIVVNETAARTLWPGENAIGQYMKADTVRRVVGVVGDVRHTALEQAAGLEMYIPIRQTDDFSRISLIVRTTLAPHAFANAIRSTLAPILPTLATNEVQTLQDMVDKSVSPRRFITSMLGTFAAFALALALLGIYGVISYTVSQRTHEIGVRIALGASAAQIQGRIIRETLALAAGGIVLGVVASWIIARLMSGFLFGVTATDPLTFAGVLALVGGVAVASGYLPARRAARIDPIVAFRSN